MKPKYLASDAYLSADGVHRYWLSRRLSMGERTMLMVGLNPSTADAQLDDPTIRRGVGFARRLGFDWFYMGNLNAYRATNPKNLPKDSLLAVGPENQDHLKWMAQRAELVIAAWGQNRLNDYAAQLGAWVLALPQAQCFGFNADGTPKHPLYLPNDTPLVSCVSESVAVEEKP